MNQPLLKWHPLRSGNRPPKANRNSRLLPLAERKVLFGERVAVNAGWVIGIRSGGLDRGGMCGVGQNSKLRGVHLEGTETYSEIPNSSRISSSLRRRLSIDRQEWQDLPLPLPKPAQVR